MICVCYHVHLLAGLQEILMNSSSVTANITENIAGKCFKHTGRNHCGNNRIGLRGHTGLVKSKGETLIVPIRHYLKSLKARSKCARRDGLRF